MSSVNLGGQAVIEGVMMRSSQFIAVAVRQDNHRIRVRHWFYQSFNQSWTLWKKPVFRGMLLLVESMTQGIKALNFSAEVASSSISQKEPTEEAVAEQKFSPGMMAFTLLSAFLFGMGLFVALPHVLTIAISSLFHLEATPKNFIFHCLDGFLKLGIFLLYIFLISRMKDIYRVFQYHGAEHKSVHAFEAGVELTIDNTKKYKTLHPRCGTSFLFFVLLISIVTFSLLLPLLDLNRWSPHFLWRHVFIVLMKINLMCPIAGITYEWTKVCSVHMQNPFFQWFIWPGMMLQKMTTREPSDAQIEVALVALQRVINLDQAHALTPFSLEALQGEIEMTGLSDLRT